MRTSARLAAVASRATCRLTHHGRKSGKPYEVTIWFMVDGDIVYLGSANKRRQWVHNVRVQPHVGIRVAGEVFTGVVEPVHDATEERHVMDLIAAKYWYVYPFVALARLAGFDPKPDATFRVHVAA